MSTTPVIAEPTPSPSGAPPAEPKPAAGTPAPASPTTPLATPPAATAPEVTTPAGDFSDILAADLKPVIDAAAGDPLAKYKDDPVIQGLIQEKTQFAPISELLKGNAYPIANPEELKLQLQDSNMLYDIMAGKATASQMLANMMASPHWPQELKSKVIADLRQFVEKATGQPIAAAAAGQPPALEDPAMKEVKALRDQIKAREDAERQQAYSQRVASAKTAIVSHLDTSLKGTWLEGEADYILGQIQGDFKTEQDFTALLDAIDRKDFNQIAKSLTRVRNQEAQRHVDRNKRLIELQKKKQGTIPQQVAGGAPPAPAADPASNVVELDPDKRRKNMLENWRAGQ